MARFCRVDLKTIHNWVDRDQIKHFRTPGRHLRFKRKDVYEFLKRFDYPVPTELQSGETAIYVLAGDDAPGQSLRRQLGGGENVRFFGDVLQLFLKVGDKAPEAIVIDVAALDLPLARVAAAIKQNEDTSAVRIVVLFDESRPVPTSERTLAHAWVPRTATRELRAALDTVLGA